MYKITKIDHVQLSAYKNCENEAREFYIEKLGFNEIEKPQQLKSNGGVWFSLGDVNLHIGIEKDFQPLKKAHPAFGVENIEFFIKHLKSQGIGYTLDDQIPNAKRLFIRDVFENRLEFIEWF